MEVKPTENTELENQNVNSDSGKLGNSLQSSEAGNLPTTYTFEQLKEVYYLGLLNGATIWQLCQDNTKEPLSSFELVTNEIKKVVTSEQSIKDLAGSPGMLLGVSAEILGLESIV